MTTRKRLTLDSSHGVCPSTQRLAQNSCKTDFSAHHAARQLRPHDVHILYPPSNLADTTLQRQQTLCSQRQPTLLHALPNYNSACTTTSTTTATTTSCTMTSQRPQLTHPRPLRRPLRQRSQEPRQRPSSSTTNTDSARSSMTPMTTITATPTSPSVVFYQPQPRHDAFYQPLSRHTFTTSYRFTTTSFYSFQSTVGFLSFFPTYSVSIDALLACHTRSLHLRLAVPLCFLALLQAPCSSSAPRALGSKLPLPTYLLLTLLSLPAQAMLGKS